MAKIVPAKKPTSNRTGRIGQAGKSTQVAGVKPSVAVVQREKDVRAREQAKKKSEEQRKQLKTRLETIKKDTAQLNRDMEGAKRAFDLSGRRAIQAKLKALSAESSVLGKAYGQIKEGGSYEKLSEITTAAKQAGSQAERADLAQHRSNRISQKDLAAQKSRERSLKQLGVSPAGVRYEDGKRVSVIDPREIVIDPVTETKMDYGSYINLEAARERATQGKDMSTFKDTKKISGDYFSNAQERYTSSLSASPSADLTIEKYKGIKLPFGQRDITWLEPQFGTITDVGAFKEVSKFDVMREQEIIDPTISMPGKVIAMKEAEKLSGEISSSLLPKYQELVSSGELTVEEAEAKYKEEASSQFDISWDDLSKSDAFKSKIKASEKFRSSFEESFSPEFKAEKKIRRLELAGDIIAGGVSAIIPPVGIGYFMGKGAYKAAKGESKDIRSGMELYSGIYSETLTGPLGIKYQSTTGLSPESKEAGISFLFGATAGISQVGKIGTEITTLRKTELASKPWTTTSEELFKKGDKTFVRVRGSKTTGFASAEGESVFPVVINKDGTFKVLAGRGKVETRVVDFMKQGSGGDDILKGTLDFGLAGRGTVSPAAYKAGGLRITTPESKMFVTSGEGQIIPDSLRNVRVVSKGGKKSKFWSKLMEGSGRGDFFITKQKIKITGEVADDSSRFLFGGISRKEGKKIIFSAGELGKARLYPSTGKFTGAFRPQSYGETFVRTTKDSTKGFAGGGKKSSKKFLDDLYGKSQSILQETKPTAVSKPKIVGEQFGGQSFEKASKITLASIKPKQSLAIKTLVTTGSAGKSAYKPESIIKPYSKLTPKEDTINRQLKSLLPASSTTPVDRQEYTPKSSQVPRTKQTTKQITQQIVPPAFTTFGSGFGGRPPSPPPQFPTPVIPFGFPKLSLSPLQKKRQGYIPQAKSRSGKWITLSKEPMTRTAALSRASRATDNTLSAQFRIKKSKGKVASNFDNYFGVTQQKYRPYKIKKGRAIQLSNHYIEKRGSRIDSSGEKTGLKLAKYAQSQGWLQPTTKRNKKKRVIKKDNQWLV